ncbi:MAG: hypothetical protein LLG04_14875 [Parachlamydia sp.]|nr:hypothetical protein [Parachlamydia sp.]
MQLMNIVRSTFVIILVSMGFSFTQGFCLHGDESLEEAEQSVVFVILTHAKDDRSCFLWKRSYDSIRKFYPSQTIVIIDDNSPQPPSLEGLENVCMIRGEHPGAGELLPYIYFLKYQWAEKMIFLHDSMFLIRPFTRQELGNSVKFHWHFSDHRWDSATPIEELLAHLENSEELIYFRNHESNWVGCFGVASMINITVLQELEAKYGFTSRLKDVVHTRDQRMALERVFGIMLGNEKLYTMDSPSNFGRIHDFPLAFTFIEEQALDEIHSSYPGAIFKTWHGR